MIEKRCPPNKPALILWTVENKHGLIFREKSGIHSTEERFWDPVETPFVAEKRLQSKLVAAKEIKLLLDTPVPDQDIVVGKVFIDRANKLIHCRRPPAQTACLFQIAVISEGIDCVQTGRNKKEANRYDGRNTITLR